MKDSWRIAARDIFEHHDQKPNYSQLVFRRFSFLFIAGTTVSGFCAALILLASGNASSDNTNWLYDVISSSAVRYTLFAIEILALGIAAFAAHIQEARKHDSRWKQQRRMAEASRIEIFNTLFKVASDKSIREQQTAFDHFITEQLDGQLKYYSSSSKLHNRRSIGLAAIGAVIAGAVAISGVGGLSENLLPIAALIGVVAPIFLTALNSWRENNNDDEKALLYDQVWTKLRILKGQSELVRVELATGDYNAVLGFVDEVHKTIHEEHKTWKPTSNGDAN